MRIGIIGGGFCGTITAAHLVRKANTPCELYLYNEYPEQLARGIAYSPYSGKQLLNVTTGKMSAFASDPDHFLNWVMQLKGYSHLERDLVAQSFLPRRIYGDYLVSIWEETLHIASSKKIGLRVIHDKVIDLRLEGKTVVLISAEHPSLTVDQCLVATGNILPGNPSISTPSFFTSNRYFQNPWAKESVSEVEQNKPVLILGNGLTMVDTVLGLLESGYGGTIVTLSPHGYSILPHRHPGMKYQALVAELTPDLSLKELASLVIKHVKRVRKLGISAEPVIESLRPYTQSIWKQLSEAEKRLFFTRFRHLWGVARHRIPLHVHDRIQQLRMDGTLKVMAGTIVDIVEYNDFVRVEYKERGEREPKRIAVSRVINCTGPETNLEKVEGVLLHTCLKQGLITQDALKLGISTDTATFRIKRPNGMVHENLYQIGTGLKGELWESTAVPELKVQAEKVADQILGR